MIYDLVIIGAGQAGLAAGYYARENKLGFLILESHKRIGDNWRQRYDSLKLFSTRALSGLPGLRFPGPRHSYPDKDEAGDYLEAYARHFELPVLTAVRVKQLTRGSDAFNLQTTSGQYQARSIIVAVGGFQSPSIPRLPGQLGGTLVQLHSSQYRNPSQIPAGTVLVVGSGNSGAAIAAELTSTHAVDLSVRSKLRFHGRHGWKKAVPYLARGSRAVYAKYTSPIGRQVRRFGIPIIGTELKQALESGKVTLRPAATSLSGGTVGFSDGSKGEYAAVIWCTGFRSSLGWIDIPGAVNPNGSPAHQFGISPVPGLYYLGLHWQRSLASALIGGVAKDARFIVQTARQHLAP